MVGWCDKGVSNVGWLAVFLALALPLWPRVGEAAGPARELRLDLSGEPEAVTLHARDACAPDDIPDAPARAIRTAGGGVRLFAAHHVNRALSGPTLDTVRPDCRVAYEGAGAGDPARFDDKAWIAALHTADGVAVHALVHDEFHGHRRPALCPSGRYMDCWYNAITYAVSGDGGLTFTRPEPPRHLVAALPYPFAGDRGRHVGYFSPSNIVAAADGFLYALIFATALDTQAAGNCLIRTDRPDDPGSWRAWDGSGFTVRFADPYQGADPAGHVCAPVGRGVLGAPVGSLTRHRPSGLWLAVFSGDGGLYTATSADLIRWSPARLAWRAAGLANARCGAGPIVAYPSLLDPDSPSPTFADTGDGAWLYYTRFNLTDCRVSMNRDLMRVRAGVAER